MKTLREEFGGASKSRVMLIYDVWRTKGGTERVQVRTDYMDIEEVVSQYGDFIYDGWYTEGWFPEDGRTKASLWACATGERRVNPVLYDNWENGLGYKLD